MILVFSKSVWATILNVPRETFYSIRGWLVGCFFLFYGVSTLFGSFNAELSHVGFVWIDLMAYQPQ